MRKDWITYVLLAFVSILYWRSISLPIFTSPESVVLYDRNQQLLGARIAADGQWRFPVCDSLPYRFTIPLIKYEDKRFFFHHGVDPFAVGRAIFQNLKAGKIVSGASTLTMQVIRLSRNGKSRNLYQKFCETILATRLEMELSKRQILNLYASHAPFGGNVVGVEAASWRYFKKPLSQLTWAEGSTLAVLPNAPSLIHPGRNRKHLQAKRDRLLEVLYHEGVIDSMEYALSLLEPIPGKPHPLPDHAPHLISQILPDHGIVHSTIDLDIQNKVLEVVDLHYSVNKQKEIYNAAVLVVDNHSGRILSYVGNTRGHNRENAVDMVKALRSSGSILKPFLYGLMMQSGMISPHQMVSDVPTVIDGFNPKNYNKQYSGAVKASDALAMSLNVPAVKMLQEYGIEAFRQKTLSLGLSTLAYSADHYGLSLILGGGEVTLFDLVNVYSRMAQKLNAYPSDKAPFNIHVMGNPGSHDITDMDNGVIFSVFEAMRKLRRPDSEGAWQQFSSSVPLAWKTGTSYGHRDAWAIGVVPEYTIGVWVGNADGEGRPEIIGSSGAGSLLFDIIHFLPVSGQWFSVPHDNLVELSICRLSGYPSGPACPEIDTLLSPESTGWAYPCPYHRMIFLDPAGMRATMQCDPAVKGHSWFVLPPDMAYFYRQNHPEYVDMPPISASCGLNKDDNAMALLYPSHHQSLYLPSGLNGEDKYPVFQASHKNPEASIFWHLDDIYLGHTTEIHNMKINVSPGIHKISLWDNDGNTLYRTFEVVGD